MRIWRPSTTGILIAGVVIVVVAVAVAFIVGNFKPTTEVKLATGTFNARVATDETARQLGLSGVEKLKPNEGLLMTFDTDDKWEIWMKDMKIPLDILWLDNSKAVIYIVKNAAPELSTSKIFKPNEPARYVLELPAGTVSQYGIKMGDVASFTVAGEGK